MAGPKDAREATNSDIPTKCGDPAAGGRKSNPAPNSGVALTASRNSGGGPEVLSVSCRATVGIESNGIPEVRALGTPVRPRSADSPARHGPPAGIPECDHRAGGVRSSCRSSAPINSSKFSEANCMYVDTTAGRQSQEVSDGGQRLDTVADDPENAGRKGFLRLIKDAREGAHD